MSDPLLIARHEGACTVLTLNRPERGNALDAGLVDALHRAFVDAIDRGARLIVLRGAGRDLCTGIDLSNVENETHGDLLLRLVNVERLLQTIHAAPVVTMAVAAGRAFGAGADLFVACDHRLCLPGAQFRFPGPAFGLVLGSRRLAERVGRNTARNILVAGTTVTDAEAMQIGLATRSVSEDGIAAAIETAASGAGRLDAETVAALHAATDAGGQDHDLAALVRSVTRPDFKDRLVEYRKSLRASNAVSKHNGSEVKNAEMERLS